MPSDKTSLNLSYTKSVIFSLILSLFSSYCLAQVDSSYIQPYDHELSIKPHVYYKYTSITHEIDDDNELTYMPNSPVSLGLGITYKNYSLSGGYGFGFMRDKDRGNTKSLDFQYHYYGRKFIADIFFQRYKGFYTEEKDDVFEIYPDIKVVQYGVHGQYVFNNKKFSYRAAFNQSEKQLKSAGSWQLGGGIYYNEIQSDSTFYLNEYKKLRNYQFSVSGGYVYNWVINKNFFLSGGVSVGMNLGIENPSDFKKVIISPSVFPRISAGYNADDWSIGLSAVINRMYVTRTNSLKMIFDTGTLQMSFIKRFDVAPKFMKKIKYIN
ncbi:MAG: DUF4421 domain-containing protein [Dysgonomonas sp.]